MVEEFMLLGKNEKISPSEHKCGGKNLLLLLDSLDPKAPFDSENKPAEGPGLDFIEAGV
jgi:hypothetical protein